MSKIYSLDDAMLWFLKHHTGSIICVNENRAVEKKCVSYAEAEDFYKNQNRNS